MGLQLGLGPVFGIESVAASRRWQLYVGRVLFVSLLLVGMWFLWQSVGERVVSIREARELGAVYFRIVIEVQLIAVMLAAPALAAGSICVDKVRGTLHHVFVTDLTNREIVLGKLGSRILSAFALMACCAPVLALGGLLGGMDYEALLRAYILTADVAVMSCSLALFFSIWVRKPHQALLPTYGVLALWSLVFVFYETLTGGRVFGIPGATYWMLMLSNPFVAVAYTYSEDDISRWLQPLLFSVVTLGFSAMLIAVAIGRLRKAVVNQANAPKKRQRADAPLRVLDYLPGPPLDADPILWREWHRKKPGKWTGRAWTAYAILSLLASAYVIFVFFTDPGGYKNRGLAVLVNTIGVTIGLVLLTISATTSLAEERDRGSLDVIMTTPLSTREILKGKWLGTFAMVPRLAILPIWINTGLALITGAWLAPLILLAFILAYSAFIASLGLALATWIPKVGRAIATGLFLLVVINFGLIVAQRYMARSAAYNSPYGYGYNYGYSWSNQETYEWLLLGSPIYGIAEATVWAGRLPWQANESLHVYHSGVNTDYVAAFGWCFALAGMAAFLLFATVATFDRCLGRITTDKLVTAPPRRAPEREPKILKDLPSPSPLP